MAYLPAQNLRNVLPQTPPAFHTRADATASRRKRPHSWADRDVQYGSKP